MQRQWDSLFIFRSLRSRPENAPTVNGIGAFADWLEWLNFKPLAFACFHSLTPPARLPLMKTCWKL